MIRLTHDPIDPHQLTESVRDHAAGAVVLFLGTVRELTEGRRTLALDYEAYPEMATAKLKEIAETASTKWPITAYGIIHRLGHLDLGDVSVAVAVSCPHRVEAFEAGRFLIDTLKEIVPIWKKEHYKDGPSGWINAATGSELDAST